MDPFVSIIMRSYNEGWALRETLPALQAQDYKNWELIVIDSGSTDGSVELIRRFNPKHFLQIRHEDYNPSRVMNTGMELARAEFGIFLNADATPQGPSWLRPLANALQDPQVAAVFGRQIPRPDCQAVFAHDYDRCFGENRESTRWEHFFSMVSSGLRKDIWRPRGFLEKMQYSEDDEYTRWCRAQGYRVVYVPESVVMHSHNYTPQQAYKRSFGEARALAAVWNGAPEEINFPKTVLLGWLNDTRRDAQFCLRSNRIAEIPHAARIRWQQRRAKLDGFREGWKFYRSAPVSGRSDARGLNGTHSTAGFDSLKIAASENRRTPKRFTLDGSDALEKTLTDLCEKILAEVRLLIPTEKLEALVLGGGYGRGQGGVLKTPKGDQPYNDLEFYVFLRGHRLLNDRRFSPALQKLGDQLSPAAGLHIEFKVDSLARLRRSPVTMFSYDLVSGHRLLWPEEDGARPSSAAASPQSPDALRLRTAAFHGCEHHLDAGKIPLSEATRLLFNRCTGLLLAKEFLRHPRLTPEPCDFIGRNLAKAQLALGDAVLAALGQYHWSCLERRVRLQQIAAGAFGVPALADSDRLKAELQTLCTHHAAGVEFKLHPRKISKSRDEFLKEHCEISALALQVWLWLENRRLNQQFPSAHDYAFSSVEKCNGVPVWRNVLLNAKTFGPQTVFDRMAGRYPRERLLNALPLLLWDELKDLRVRRHLQNQLRTAASDWQSFVAAYKAVWPKFG